MSISPLHAHSHDVRYKKTCIMSQTAQIPFKVSLVQDDFHKEIVHGQGGYIQCFVADAPKTLIEVTIPYFDIDCFDVCVFSSSDIKKGDIYLEETAFVDESSEMYEHVVSIIDDPEKGYILDPEQKTLYVAILNYDYSYCVVYQIAVVRQKHYWFLRKDVVAECVIYRNDTKKNKIWVHWDGLHSFKTLRRFLTQNTDAYIKSAYVEDENDVHELHNNAPLLLLPRKNHIPVSNDPGILYCFVKEWDMLRGEGVVVETGNEEEEYAVTLKMIRVHNPKPCFIYLEVGTIVEVELDQRKANTVKYVRHYGYPEQPDPAQHSTPAQKGMIPGET